jgi:hypothetical protein
MQVQHFERDDFLLNYWDYQAGQHVGLIGPSQRAGKTTFAFQLLEHTPDYLPAAVLVMKPRDPTVSAGMTRLGYKEVDNWPPPPRMPWQPKHTRHVVWPRHTFNVEEDNAHLKDVLGRALNHRYKTGDGIVFADELYGLTVELGLNSEVEALLTRGGGMGAGLWFATQKPSGTRAGGITTFAYNNPTWMFLSRDPVKANTDRYAEMQCGIDPGFIQWVTMNLPPFHWLCINRDGPYMCTVGN